MIKIETAVFIFAGFLDSGKTTALQGSLLRDEIAEQGKALIICTEEGDEEYRTEELKKKGITLVTVDDEEEMTVDFLEKLDDKYAPDKVFVEFNGMWNLKNFVDIQIPKGWYIANIFCFVDASTYEMYLKNMRQTIMEPLKLSDVVLFNRCDEKFKKGDVRRALKILNGRADIFFANLDGSIDDGIEELFVPDENNIINVTDDIFCPWFVDCLENTEKYYGKTVHLKGMVTRGRGLTKSQFYIGRYAAICCPADAQFIGFIADYTGDSPDEGEWAEVEARMERGMVDGTHQIILLKVTDLKIADAPEDVFLYF